MPDNIPLTYDKYHTDVYGGGGRLNVIPFPSEYFSAADVSVYFNEQFVDEAHDLNFVLQQEVTPIYGYNSYTYDVLAVGKRIIQGSFSINYKESNYLEKKISGIESSPKQVSYNASLIDRLRNNPNICTKYPELVNSDTKYSSNIIMRIFLRDDPEINAIIDDVKKYYWGNDEEFELQDESPFLNKRFSIVVAFGQIPHAETFNEVINGKVVSHKSGNENLSQAFRIIDSLGSTVMLTEVQIINVTHQYNIDQESPILEVYNFIARDLSKSVFAK